MFIYFAISQNSSIFAQDLNDNASPSALKAQGEKENYIINKLNKRNTKQAAQNDLWKIAARGDALPKRRFNNKETLTGNGSCR